MLIADIIETLESKAPLRLQEDYDNSGLQVGLAMQECTGVMLCVDVTLEIVAEAKRLGCNLIVSHHPLFFKGIKQLTGATPIQEIAMSAIVANIAIYSCHTALDNAYGGVSWTMAQKLGLADITVLSPRHGQLLKLAVMVPSAHAELVRLALFDAGAGHIGNYDCCSYSTDGIGSFRALDGANPFVGDILNQHHEPEVKIEVILPAAIQRRVESALREVHPYEEPAYDFIPLVNDSTREGSGAYGVLNTPITPQQLVELVKQQFGSPIVRCTRIPDYKISRIALCGGAGAFLIPRAIASGAQAMITSDTRYHDFVDYANSLFIIDIGHYESEHCTKEIFYRVITEKFPNFAVYNSETEKNPINYL
jgi:dinuclear metal center YbgI/SA1388 family protein